MEARRILVFIGSLWELARFFFLLFILGVILSAGKGWEEAANPWILLLASASLLMPVGGVLLSLYPIRYGGLVGLLRLGKVLELFSLLLLMVSGTLAESAGIVLLRLGNFRLTQAVVLPMVMFLDFAFFAFLIAYRSDTGGKAASAGKEVSVLPDFTETEIKDLH
jgi:hypothetical protein